MGNKLESIKNQLDQSKNYSLEDAVAIIQKNSFVKFDETLDVAINLGVDPRRSDQLVRGVVSLPSGIGKNVIVAMICKEDKEEEAKNAGADFVGADQIIDDIKNGKIAFDVCVATPDMMGVVGQVARILGPKGLMPNPKLGTVSVDFVSAIKKAKDGQVEYRVDKGAVIHAGLGKISFTQEGLLKNVKAFLDSVVKSKPSGVKGAYIKQVVLSSTMGASVKIDLSQISS